MSKLIIAGSRSIDDYDFLKQCVWDLDLEITEVVCGMCKSGVDMLGYRYAKENNIAYENYEVLLETPEILILIREHIDARINQASDFRTCERVFKFAHLCESFSVGKELSGKQELMRHKIVELYHKEIDSLFD